MIRVSRYVRGRGAMIRVSQCVRGRQWAGGDSIIPL